MGLLSFLKNNDDGSKSNGKPSDSANMFSKAEMENIIGILSKISYLFRDSQLLKSTGGGRNESMMSKVHSYIGILGYYYEVVYHYGKLSNIVDSQIASHFVLVKMVMGDSDHRNTTVKELSDNWSDVLQVIFNMQLESNSEGSVFKQMKTDIDKVSSAFEKMSGKKCREPKDPRNVTPRKVSYNPLNITEDPNLSRGHIIPDISHVFAQELLPQLMSSQYSGKAQKDIVADYTIDLLQSYSSNAGFLPMVIVDMVTGQVNQVVSSLYRVSYSPCDSLKEYILSKIYR